MPNRLGAHGGKREGAGRKAHGIKGLAKHLPQDIAGLVLVEIQAHKKWLQLANSTDEKIQLDTMKYLTDRAYGKAKQAIDLAADVSAEVVHRVVFSGQSGR